METPPTDPSNDSSSPGPAVRVARRLVQWAVDHPLLAVLALVAVAVGVFALATRPSSEERRIKSFMGSGSDVKSCHKTGEKIIDSETGNRVNVWSCAVKHEDESYFHTVCFEVANGRGVVNILAADQLMSSPKLYATLLLWMLAELFERLPEVGDPEKPRLVFFFDEAHLLFNDAPKALLEKIEQVVRLIRSKGVGVYFVTQNPLDIPDAVLGQLGNSVQHALRAFTPRDQKAVKSAAETMRPNPAFKIEQVITELGVGEALV